MSVKTVDALFSELENVIHREMDEIKDVKVDDSFLYRKYDRDSLHAFCLDVIERIGFDKTRAAVGITAHPYTTSLGSDDHRISTRYSDASLFDPVSSIIHETGHLMYELAANANEKIKGTTLAQGVSMGIHESQSRFWENIIGRSRAFWVFQYQRLQKYIPHLSDVSLDDFVKAINKVQPSAIRGNADEMTYNLHIILRYEVEKAMLDKRLPISSLPEYWNELSDKIIRYKVKSDSEGILQDVHWSQGNIGYFPTYAIGNIYSAAFYRTMCTSLGGEDRVFEYLEEGDYEKITSWQRENIWKNGCIYPPSELFKKVTGDNVDVAPFKEYLDKKFRNIYLK